jgi:hypothetical protein
MRISWVGPAKVLIYLENCSSAGVATLLLVCHDFNALT